MIRIAIFSAMVLSVCWLSLASGAMAQSASGNYTPAMLQPPSLMPQGPGSASASNASSAAPTTGQPVQTHDKLSSQSREKVLTRVPTRNRL